MRPYGRVSLTRLMYDYFGVWLLELLCQESNWSDHLWSDQTSSIPVNCLASSPFLDHPRLLLQQMHQFSRMKRSCGELGNRVFAQRCMFAALQAMDACLDDWVVSMVNLAEGIDPLALWFLELYWNWKGWRVIVGFISTLWKETDVDCDLAWSFTGKFAHCKAQHWVGKHLVLMALCRVCFCKKILVASRCPWNCWHMPAFMPNVPPCVPGEWMSENLCFPMSFCFCYLFVVNSSDCSDWLTSSFS